MCGNQCMVEKNKKTRKHLREPGAPVCLGSGRNAIPGTVEKAVPVSPLKRKTKRRRRSKSAPVVVVSGGLPGHGRRK